MKFSDLFVWLFKGQAAAAERVAKRDKRAEERERRRVLEEANDLMRKCFRLGKIIEVQAINANAEKQNKELAKILERLGEVDKDIIADEQQYLEALPQDLKKLKKLEHELKQKLKKALKNNALNASEKKALIYMVNVSRKQIAVLHKQLEEEKELERAENILQKA